MILPIALGAGALLAFLLSGKKQHPDSPEAVARQIEAATKATQALESGNTEAAVANALASKDKEIALAVSRQLVSEGKTEEALQLGEAFNQITIEDQKIRESLPAPSVPTTSTSQPVATTVTVVNEKPAGGDQPAITALPAPEPENDPMMRTAMRKYVSRSRRSRYHVMRSNLKAFPKGQEDRSLVKAFQKDEGLKEDGLFGPKSYAAALRTYGNLEDLPFPRYLTANRQADFDTAKSAVYTVIKTRGGTELKQIGAEKVRQLEAHIL